MLRVARNYPRHMKYVATGWRCPACALEVREAQEHLARCEGYSDIRAGKALTVESELVKFVKSVVASRKEMHGD